MVVRYVDNCTAKPFLSLPKISCAIRTPVLDSDSHRKKQILFFQTFLSEYFLLNNKISPLSTHRDAIHIFHLFQHPFTRAKLILGGVNSTPFAQNAAKCEELNQSPCNSQMHCRWDWPTTSHWPLADRMSHCHKRASVWFFWATFVLTILWCWIISYFWNSISWFSSQWYMTDYWSNAIHNIFKVLGKYCIYLCSIFCCRFF